MKFEDLKTALESDPALIGQIVGTFKDELVKALEAAAMIVRTKEQDEQYVAAAIQTQMPGKVGEEFGKAMRAIDEKIQAITGIEKKPGEKTTDYAARAIEEKKASGGGDSVTKQRIADLEAQIAKMETDHKTALGDAQKRLFDYQVNGQLDAALANANFAIPVHLQKDEEKQAYVALQRDAVRGLFLSQFQPKTDDTGALIFYEGDKARLSAKDGKPLGAAELIGEKFGQFFAPPGKSGAGSGQGAPGKQPSGGGTFTSVDDIHTHLQAKGLKVGSLEYMNELASTAKEANIEL